MFDLTGRVAVVTGASAGIGVQMAAALARQGADIALVARRLEKLERVAESLRGQFGVRVLPIVADMTSTEEVNSAAEQVMDEFGRVDILVNNAGGSKSAPLEDMTDEEWDYGIHLSLNATFKATRAFGKHMLEVGYGRIINVASVLGLGGSPGFPVSSYSAAKGAVISFTRSTAAEWAQTGITANCLAPGFFASESNTEEMLKEMEDFIIPRTPMGRIGEAGELDSAVVFLAADESSYVTGTTLTIDGGWTAV